VKPAWAIRHYRASIEYRCTNGTVEANNSVIDRLRRNANSFHNPESFIAMIMLDRGEFGPNSPLNHSRNAHLVPQITPRWWIRGGYSIARKLF